MVCHATAKALSGLGLKSNADTVGFTSELNFAVIFLLISLPDSIIHFLHRHHCPGVKKKKKIWWKI